MELLNGTRIEVKLSGSASTPLACSAFFRDFPAALNTTGFDKNITTVNSTSSVILMDEPASGFFRRPSKLNIYNSDNAIQHVTIQLAIFSGGNWDTKSIELVAPLSPGERIEYMPGQGYRIFTQAGALKTQTAQGTILGAGNWVAFTLANDVTNNNATLNTMQDVTGMSFPVVNGKAYQFVFEGCYDAQIATTGSRWSVVASNSGDLVYWNEWTLAATTRTTGTYNSNDQPAASNTTSVIGLSNRFRVTGNFVATADGTIQLRHASEVANSYIIAKGKMCTCDYREVA
jgi:hypothetical protein